MSGAAGSVYNLDPWRAFYRFGVFANGDVVTDATLNDGDLQIPLDALPNNIFAGITGTDPSVGKGRRLILDPGGGNEQEITIRDLALDPATTLLLKDPISLGGPLVAPVDIGFSPRSPTVFVGNYPKRVEFILTTHFEDDRGNAASSAPDVSFDVYMAARREGPFFLKTGLLSLAPTAPAGSDKIVSETIDLPALPYLQVEIKRGVTDPGDTVFTLEMMRSER